MERKGCLDIAPILEIFGRLLPNTHWEQPVWNVRLAEIDIPRDPSKQPSLLPILGRARNLPTDAQLAPGMAPQWVAKIPSAHSFLAPRLISPHRLPIKEGRRWEFRETARQL